MNSTFFFFDSSKFVICQKLELKKNRDIRGKEELKGKHLLNSAFILFDLSFYKCILF